MCIRINLTVEPITIIANIAEAITAQAVFGSIC